jgi:hypothetical protein
MNTRQAQLPSNHRKRREMHVQRDAEMKSRKRLRRLRAEIHAAMAVARRMVEDDQAQPVEMPAPKPYRAPDVKDPLGWQILDAAGSVVAHEKSRDKARGAAKEMNESDDFYTYTCVDTARRPMTQDEAMLSLGWRRATKEEIAEHYESNPRERHKALPVEVKYRHYTGQEES